MSKKKKKKDIRTTVVAILENAEEKKELYNQTTDHIIDLIYDEMNDAVKALRNNPNIMWDDNADDFLTKYIRRKYYNKIDQNESANNSGEKKDQQGNQQPVREAHQ